MRLSQLKKAIQRKLFGASAHTEDSDQSNLDVRQWSKFANEPYDSKTPPLRFPRDPEAANNPKPTEDSRVEDQDSN